MRYLAVLADGGEDPIRGHQVDQVNQFRKLGDGRAHGVVVNSVHRLSFVVC